MDYREIMKRLDNKNPSIFESAVLKLIRKLETEASIYARDYNERGAIIQRLEAQLKTHGATVCGQINYNSVGGVLRAEPPCHWLRVGSEKLCPDCNPRAQDSDDTQWLKLADAARAEGFAPQADVDAFLSDFSQPAQVMKVGETWQVMVPITGNKVSTMTDNQFISYCEMHCKTERILFHANDVNRLSQLAGGYCKPVSGWVSLHKEMEEMCKLARAKASE